MGKSLNPRIEYDLKQIIDDIAGDDRTITETAASMIEVGVVVRESGAEPQIKGPFGLPRPFAKISLGDQTSELRTEISDGLYERLVDAFDNKPNTAAREAIRLGVLAVAGDQFVVEGPAGGPRPFAKIDLSQIDEQDTRELIGALQSRL